MAIDKSTHIRIQLLRLSTLLFTVLVAVLTVTSYSRDCEPATINFRRHLVRNQTEFFEEDLRLLLDRGHIVRLWLIGIAAYVLLLMTGFFWYALQID
jgi:hypothetical protein